MEVASVFLAGSAGNAQAMCIPRRKACPQQGKEKRIPAPVHPPFFQKKAMQW